MQICASMLERRTGSFTIRTVNESKTKNLKFFCEIAAANIRLASQLCALANTSALVLLFHNVRLYQGK